MFFPSSTYIKLQIFLATSLKCCGFFQVQQMLRIFLATSLKCCGFFPSSANVADFSSHFPEVLRFFFPSSANVADFSSHFPEVLRFFFQVQQMLRIFLATSLNCCGFFPSSYGPPKCWKVFLQLAKKGNNFGDLGFCTQNLAEFKFHNTFLPNGWTQVILKWF